MKHTGEAHMDTTVAAAATAKVGAKGEAHLVMLQEGEEGLEVRVATDEPERPRPLMVVPRKRRHR